MARSQILEMAASDIPDADEWTQDETTDVKIFTI